MNPEHSARNTSDTGAFRIIPRAEHAISRKSISNGALRVLYRLHEAGYQAFLVGGAVRDLLLGGHPKDFDVATDATPEEVRALFRNCRLIGRRFRLAHVVFGREIVEVATFRGSSDDGSGDRHLVDGRLVRDNVYGTIEEDAVRRDFTVNALYYNIADFSVRDAVGGMADLEHRVLRLIGDPDQRYHEDPVRMLRAARLAAKLGFEIAPDTAAPFATLGPLLAEAAPARLFDEALKLFLSGYGLASFRALERYGLLEHVFPATARVLQAGAATHVRELIERTLANTDARVREDKPVTPAFLFAALLWEPARRLAQALIDEGTEPTLAWSHAGERVLREQTHRVAVPRRFTIAIEEIWGMQPRFAQRSKKRALRLLEHPRFRAAYDFLVLRASESAALAELATWWTEAQELEREALAERLASAPPPSTPEEGEAPAKRKRPRRRRRKRGAGAPAAGHGGD
ncbi:MAG: polynucleotide adenylyltransferase PcnB [Rhodanobacteraceae bacterium]|jgi:poly(A) polymerase|nr:polynucleotide adenylyltransferase PcnB [Rhodanobacteraceae bacterium]